MAGRARSVSGSRQRGDAAADAGRACGRRVPRVPRPVPGRARTGARRIRRRASSLGQSRLQPACSGLVARVPRDRRSRIPADGRGAREAARRGAVHGPSDRLVRVRVRRGCGRCERAARPDKAVRAPTPSGRAGARRRARAEGTGGRVESGRYRPRCTRVPSSCPVVLGLSTRAEVRIRERTAPSSAGSCSRAVVPDDGTLRPRPHRGRAPAVPPTRRAHDAAPTRRRRVRAIREGFARTGARRDRLRAPTPRRIGCYRARDRSSFTSETR